MLVGKVESAELQSKVEENKPQEQELRWRGT